MKEKKMGEGEREENKKECKVERRRYVGKFSKGEAEYK